VSSTFREPPFAARKQEISRVRKPRRLTIDELAPFTWNLPRPETGSPASIEWATFFGNAQPVEVEVGMGKGKFLLQSAQTRPDTNFLGIEIVRKYQLYATTRFAIRKLPNVKTACADAKIVLRDHMAPASLSAVHVYFPDPWWKQRHRKRRVFTPEFAALTAKVLKEGGHLHIATDVPEYFQVMMAIVRAMPEYRESLTPEEKAPENDRDCMTNFERKARLKGTAIDRAIFERISTPAP